jgi:hypothetical protein
MSVGLNHQMVVAYLDRVAVAAAAQGLPAGRRAELLAELEAHLAEALGPAPDAAAVRTALDRLGEPEEIVAAERWPAAQPSRPSVWGAGEVLAVLALTVGGLVLPVVGPLVGLALAWASPRWTRPEKVVATVICALPSVALAGAALLLLGVRTGVVPTP